MTSNEIYAILPLMILGAAIVVLMLLIAVRRSHIAAYITALFSLVICVISLFGSACDRPQNISNILIMDSYSFFYIAVILITAAVITILSYDYVRHKEGIKEEYYIFLLTAVLGSAIVVSSIHFIALFIGIELLGVSLYVLIAYWLENREIEAGLKYLTVAAVSMGFLLFGIALIYGASGTMKFSQPASILQTNGFLFLAGIGLVLVGVCFKLAIVPFHFWAPDVFEGSPAPVTAFLATVSKGAVFAFLMRYFLKIEIVNTSSLFYIFASLAVASMFYGNITALMQNNIKRLLAYSSIAHFGYLLVILIVGGSIAVSTASFYLAAYFITTLIAFGVITVMSYSGGDLDNIDDYRGLFVRRPFIAFAMALAMLSLAGIPLTAGFIAKFYIIVAGAGAKLWTLLTILIINSVIGLFYYLKIVIALFNKSGQLHMQFPAKDKYKLSFSFLSVSVLSVLMILLVFWGIFPASLINLTKNLLSGIF